MLLLLSGENDNGDTCSARVVFFIEMLVAMSMPGKTCWGLSLRDEFHREKRIRKGECKKKPSTKTVVFDNYAKYDRPALISSPLLRGLPGSV